MPRRIEIELTSRTPDGAFTWRAAGAKQPRGTVEPSLLPPDTGVGDVLRAEVESAIDGVEIVSVLARPGKSEEAPANRIEVLGAPRRGPDVLVTYAPGARRRRDDRPWQPDGRDDTRREGGSRTPRGRGSAETRPRGGEPDGTAVRPSDAGGAEAERGDRRRPDTRPGRRPASSADGREERAPRQGQRPGARPGGGRPGPGRPGRSETADGEERQGGPARRERRTPVSTTYRNAMLAGLGPQEIPVAEQLLRGGIPAVRQALADQRASGRGGPAGATNADAVLAIAEQLLPRVNLANWKDRATVAQATGRELRLRELRAVVTGSRTVTLDDEARTLARSLQESLDQRVTALRDEWLRRMTASLDEGRVAEAVRLSARPPEPATRVPAELAVRLAERAGAAMTAETPPEEWLALLDAVVQSPVRRTVRPQGIPPVPECQEAALRAAGSVPELAKLLGLRIPPPPPRRPAARRPTVMAVGGGAAATGR